MLVGTLPPEGLGFQSKLHHLQVLWPWTGSLLSLSMKSSTSSESEVKIQWHSVLDWIQWMFIKKQKHSSSRLFCIKQRCGGQRGWVRKSLSCNYSCWGAELDAKREDAPSESVNISGFGKHQLCFTFEWKLNSFICLLSCSWTIA